MDVFVGIAFRVIELLCECVCQHKIVIHLTIIDLWHIDYQFFCINGVCRGDVFYEIVWHALFCDAVNRTHHNTKTVCIDHAEVHPRLRL